MQVTDNPFSVVKESDSYIQWFKDILNSEERNSIEEKDIAFMRGAIAGHENKKLYNNPYDDKFSKNYMELRCNWIQGYYNIIQNKEGDNSGYYYEETQTSNDLISNNLN